jgi:capsular polysaccharide export protein
VTARVDPEADHGRRSTLFLQGPLSPLYAMIGDRLEARGHAVHRINLCVGDSLDWRRPGAVAYRGSLAKFPAFVARVMDEHAVTDLVLHGDRRLYHRAAAEAARPRGIVVAATELGYLRPDFMTIERDATATGSHFPEDPDAIRAIAAAVPPPDLALRYRGSFAAQAVPDVVYNLANSLFWFLHPGYRRHTIHHPFADYAAWGLRLLTERRRQAEADILLAALVEARTPFFVFAMQLEGDFQVRDHSPYGSLRPALDEVFASFRAHAPADTLLVVKNHPLDNGLEGWRGAIHRLAAVHGLRSRVHFADGGGLAPLVEASRGVVTVNSTAGLEALQRGAAVKTLAPAIYDVPGLVDPGPLDGFWRTPRAPDPALLDAFVRALAATVQVKGTIYSKEGCAAAADAMAARIHDRTLNAPGGYVDPPPRLARARALGCPL